MNNADQISQILTITLVVLGTLLGILIVVYLGIVLKNKKNIKNINNKNNNNTKEKNAKETVNSKTTIYTKASIFDFMEFDKIEDNMIVQKNGLRYIMVLQCQGVNYDLLSQAEKNGVEEGFIEFLNTLRYPIQLYIQTRTVNLDKSIRNYKENVDELERKLAKNRLNYENNINMGMDKKQLDKQYYEIVKQTNLLEYGKDIINNTQKMSKNKNVLNNKYYIVMYYYPDEINENIQKFEIQEMAFSELYTRAQAIIRALYSCDVSAKILTSNEIAELLYVSYNRDESDVFDFETAMKSGFTELYSTSPDIWQKKIETLNKEIEDRAIEIANETIEKVKSEAQQQYELKSKSIDEIASEMAKLIISENDAYIGEDIADEAIKKLDSKIDNWEEEGNNEEKQTKRGRKSKSTAS